jgi:hypothetical protein
MTPSGPELSVLLAVLAECEVDAESTADVGAGLALADVSLVPYDFALAVIPAGRRERDVSLSAIYVEIGVAAARDLPLIVIAESPDPPSPALAGVATIITQLDNEEALRLQIGLFVRRVQAVPRAQRSARPPTRTTAPVPESYAARLHAARTSPPGLKGFAFEQLVSDLLRETGAQAEQRSAGEPDMGVDIAAFIPGEEQRLGTVMFQVKSGELSDRALREVQQRLSDQVLQAGAGLGVLVYDQITPAARNTEPAPLVLRLGIDELLAELETRPLSAVLIQARNRAVHGM